MDVRHGSAIVKQIAAGPLFFHHRPCPQVTEHSLLTPDVELARFFRAQQQAVTRLESLRDQADTQIGPDAAAIFSIHAMLAEDEDLAQAVQDAILAQNATAEWAVLSNSRAYAQTLADLPDPYMQARAADIRDVARQILSPLIGFRNTVPLQAPSIVVADHFLPSEILSMGRRVLGLVSLRGSVNSHTSLLLQAYRIPAVIGLDLDESWEGHPALLDGHTGTLYLDPDRALLEELRQRHQADGAPLSAAL